MGNSDSYSKNIEIYADIVKLKGANLYKDLKKLLDNTKNEETKKNIMKDMKNIATMYKNIFKIDLEKMQ